jgi:hypothetical protein
MRALNGRQDFQGGTLFDWSFPARCAGLIPFAAFSAEDKLGHYLRLRPYWSPADGMS